MKTILAQLALFTSIGLAAGDWPQFRGPSGNGVVNDPKLPTKLGSENVVWAIDLPGRGLSSPIIVGDRIFVTCATGPREGRVHGTFFSATGGKKKSEGESAA